MIKQLSLFLNAKAEINVPYTAVAAETAGDPRTAQKLWFTENISPRKQPED